MAFPDNEDHLPFTQKACLFVLICEFWNRKEKKWDEKFNQVKVLLF